MMTYPPDDREFVPPEWMKLPNDIQLPSSIRMHNLIEKTALFISKHGSQMEILVKAKQAKNPQFDFLEFDSPLNKYYKYLITSMKSGDYVSSLDRPTGSDGSDDEDHYLHPSLLGSAAKTNKSPERLFLPHLPRVPDENSSYSQLVKSLKDKIIREPEKKPEDEQSSLRSISECDNLGRNAKNLLNNDNRQLPASQPNNYKSDSISILPLPPPEVQLYIDKLAEHVARKGEDFEKTIKKRNEARFEFLNPGNVYHCHYIKRKLHFLEEKRQAQAEDIMAKTSLSTIDSGPIKGPVSFSLSNRENKRTVIVKDDGSPDHLDKRKDSDSDLDEQICSEISSSWVSKEKQEERRRKAALFLSLLKKKQSVGEMGIDKRDESNDYDQHKNGTNNGNPRVESPSRNSNASLSPTIEAVTSPASLSKNLVDHSDDDSSNSEHSSSKHRANSESSKPSSSVLPFKSSDRSKRDKSSSTSPSSSTCSKQSSHHKPHHHHHHHHHPHPHHRHHGHHHGHHPPHPPTPPHHRHHHHGHHKHHRHHRHRHGRKRRSRSRSLSRSRSHSASTSRSRSPSRSPHRKSRRRRYS